MEQSHDQPGPELDVRLAKAFGWDVYTTVSGDVRARRNFEDSSGFDFNASREWNGMQLVVEEMQRRGWIFTLSYDGYKWIAAFFKYGDVIYHEAETAPHAVALAALGALEGQRDE